MATSKSPVSSAARCALTGLGFGASLNLIQVDRFIVQYNIQRETSQKDLDLVYLASLSDVAVPFLFEAYRIRVDQFYASYVDTGMQKYYGRDYSSVD